MQMSRAQENVHVPPLQMQLAGNDFKASPSWPLGFSIVDFRIFGSYVFRVSTQMCAASLVYGCSLPDHFSTPFMVGLFDFSSSPSSSSSSSSHIYPTSPSPSPYPRQLIPQVTPVSLVSRDPPPPYAQQLNPQVALVSRDPSPSIHTRQFSPPVILYACVSKTSKPLRHEMQQDAHQNMCEIHLIYSFLTSSCGKSPPEKIFYRGSISAL